MFDDRIGNLQKMLARMGPEGRQRYAADHADDPIAVSMALFVNNIAKELKEGKRGEPEIQTPVVQQAIQAMNQPRMPQGMPPQGMPPQGQPQAPQGMPPPQGQTQMAADGGYMDSRLPEEMGIGALPERSLSNMADGGIVGYAAGGSKGKKLPSFNDALNVEGITDPRQQAFLKALYGQESSSGANTTTSNQGAVGHMQIKPGTFKQVADKGMDINNAFDNMRAGIRYGMQGYRAAGGDPVLAGAYYYGGPGGMEALVKGEVRTDPKNPKAPNTLEYGKSIAQRMTALLPIGTAQAETPPSAAAPATKSATTADLQALRQSNESFGDKAKTLGQVARSLVQNPLAQVASGFAGLAGSVSPGPEGQGADYVKRAQDYLGYNPEYTEESKKILGALGYPLELLREYAADPAGEYLAGQGFPATGATVKGAIEAAPAALGFAGRLGKGTAAPAATAPTAAAAPATSTAATAATAPAATTAGVPIRTVPTAAQRAAAAQAVPKSAAAPTPAIRTTLTPEQINAGLGAPPLVGPRKPIVVPAPKTPPTGGLATISPEAAALRAAAEARSKARAAERTAAAAVAATERPPAVVAAERPPAVVAAERPPAVVAAERPPTGRPAVVAAEAEAAGVPKPAVVAAEAEAAAPKPANRPAAVVAAEAEAAGAPKPANRPAAVAAGEGAVAGAESRMAAARAATGEGRGPGISAFLPAVLAAGAGTGSGETSSNAREPYSTGNYQGKSGIAELDIGPAQAPLKLTPEVKKEAVALAKAEIPKEERSGFGYEDLLMFGLNLMAGQSSNAFTNVGTAGVAALTAKQARTAAEKKTALEERKIASDEKKEAAMAKYYEKYGSYLEAEGNRKAEEDKPLAQLNKEIAAAYMELNKDLMLRSDPVKMAAAKRQARADLIANYPELESTIGGGGFRVLGSRASP